VTQIKSGGLPIVDLHAAAYRIPTDSPEADGTFSWEATTLVVVEAEAKDGQAGLGYTYADASIASLIAGQLKKTITGRDGFDVRGCWLAMHRSVRNLGRSGLAARAISAVDAALWDLKARTLGLPLATCSAATAITCRSTGVAGSRAIRTSSYATNLQAGWSAMAAAL
jgi:L-alanine-DL-glutamate epimerase-like enolase superfamily enzyme